MNRYKKELQEKLKNINALLNSRKMSLELVIVGGAAFILKNLVARATSDIDFIKETNKKAIDMLNDEGFDVNGCVDIYIDQFGIEWDTDLEIIIKMDNLVVKTISTERLMISRLFSNKRHEDFEDSIKSANITKEKFEEIFEEVYSIAYEMNTRNFKENYYMIKDLYDKKGWNYENSNIKNLCK